MSATRGAEIIPTGTDSRAAPTKSDWLLVAWIGSYAIGVDVFYEFKLFDLMAIAGGLTFRRSLAERLRRPARDEKLLLAFALLLCVQAIRTIVVKDDLLWLGIVGVRTFRFLSYVCMFLVIRGQQMKPALLQRLLGTVVVVTAGEALLIVFQSMNALPMLWPESEWSGASVVPTGTLGPNHLNSVVFMTIGVGAVIGVWRLRFRSGWISSLPASLLVALMATAMLLGEARSGLVALAVLLAIVFRGRQVILALSLVVVAIPAIRAGSGRDPLAEVAELWNGRVAAKVSIGSEGGLAGVEVKEARIGIWKATWNALTDDPRKILAGVGFQNFPQLLPTAAAAHNQYLHVLVEMGLVGLGVYLLWLRSVWARLRGLKRCKAGRAIGNPAMACYVALLIVGLFNEVFYASRATPGLFGFLLAYLAINTHGGWYRDGNSESARNARGLRRGRRAVRDAGMGGWRTQAVGEKEALAVTQGSVRMEGTGAMDGSSGWARLLSAG